MADIVLLFILKGRDCMSKVLIEVLVIILIAGSYLILYSAVRVSAISEQRIAEIRSRETFDKEKQLKTNQSSISGGMAMTNKEKKITFKESDFLILALRYKELFEGVGEETQGETTASR